MSVRLRACHNGRFPVGSHALSVGTTRECPAHCHLLVPRSPSSQFPPFSGMDSARHPLSQVSLSRQDLVFALCVPSLRGQGFHFWPLPQEGGLRQGMSPSRGRESGCWVATNVKMMENKLHPVASPGSGLSTNSLRLNLNSGSSFKRCTWAIAYIAVM